MTPRTISRLGCRRENDVSYKLTYHSPTGEEFDFTQQAGAVNVLWAGVKGLVGQPEVAAVSSFGTVGRRRHALNTVEAKGSLELIAEHAVMSAFYPRLRAAFSPAHPGLLAVEHAGVWREAEVYLDAPIPWPESDPDDERNLIMTVDLINDAGVWWEPEQSGSGAVVVENPGDVELYPAFVWGPGKARVTLPSGATVKLPAVAGRRRLSTDHADAFVVTGLDDTVDERASEAVQAWPEGIPPGQSRVFASDSASIVWRVGVWDPLRETGGRP